MGVFEGRIQLDRFLLQVSISSYALFTCSKFFNHGAVSSRCAINRLIAALREISLQFLHFLLVWKSPLYLSFALSHYLKDVLLMHFPMKIYVLTTIEGRDISPPAPRSQQQQCPNQETLAREFCHVDTKLVIRKLEPRRACKL